MINHKWEKYVQSFLSNSKKLKEKSKVYVEVRKLKWELNNKYQELGKYVTIRMETQSVIDFSHDQKYINKINEIIKIKHYIKILSKQKGMKI